MSKMSYTVARTHLWSHHSAPPAAAAILLLLLLLQLQLRERVPPEVLGPERELPQVPHREAPPVQAVAVVRCDAVFAAAVVVVAAAVVAASAVAAAVAAAVASSSS